MDPTSFDGRQPVPDDSRYAMEEDSDLPLYEDYNDRADQSSGMQKDEPPSFRELLRLVCSLPVALFIMLVRAAEDKGAQGSTFWLIVLYSMLAWVPCVPAAPVSCMLTCQSSWQLPMPRCW